MYVLKKNQLQTLFKKTVPSPLAGEGQGEGFFENVYACPAINRDNLAM